MVSRAAARVALVSGSMSHSPQGNQAEAFSANSTASQSHPSSVASIKARSARPCWRRPPYRLKRSDPGFIEQPFLERGNGPCDCDLVAVDNATSKHGRM